MEPAKQGAVAWEERWSLPVALATLAAVGFVAAAIVVAGQSIGGGDGDSTFLREVDQHRSAQLISSVLQAIGVGLLAAPLYYLFRAANARIRRQGTANLLAAARAAGATRFLAQSVAWRLDGDGGAATEELERSVLAAGGVVLRYGQFYGPGTYHEQAPPPPPRVHVDQAARRTVAALEAPTGVLTIVED